VSRTVAEAARDEARGSDAPALRVERIDSVDALAHEWDAFIESCARSVGTEVYFTGAWLRAWWKRYGRGRRPVILVVRAGDRIVAALPFCVGRLWAGVLPVRVVRWMGADSTIPVLTPPIEPGFEARALASAIAWLREHERFDCLSLSPMSGASPAGDAALVAAENAGLAVVRNDDVGTHTLFRLPATFDEYLANLEKRQRGNYRRDVNQLSKRFDFADRVVRGSEAQAHFDAFVTMHQGQWQADGRLGHFGDWPKSESFNREVVAALAPADGVRFHELIADGATLSMQYSLVFGGVCCWRLPAREAGPEFDKFGLGRVGLVKMIEALIGEGVRTIEAGPGHYDYKVKHGGEEFPLRRIVVATPGWGALKASLLLRWADLVNLVYYRAWFLKASRRLGPLRRPLWRGWIRTRL
jgi:CelD/BcsL family acetyltransferase involved in cellulose biosynthesis